MPDQGEGQSGKQGAGEGQGEGQPKTETYKVVVSGQEMEVPLTELLNGYQRHADYTKKTQELSAREKKISEEIESKAMELYLKALKDGEGAGAEGQRGGEGKGKEGQDVDPSRIKALEDRIAKSEADRLNADAERELNTHIEAVTKKYPKADVDKVLIQFYKNADESTDVAKFFDETAAAMQKTAEVFEQKIIDDYVKRRMHQATGGVESGGSAARTGAAPKPVTTFEEARERAEERIRAVRGA